MLTLIPFQGRWGYTNISNLQEIVDGYAAADIPLETIWNDIDVYQLYRDFTNVCPVSLISWV